GNSFDINAAFQAVHHALHDVEAHASARNLGDLLGGAEPRTEYILESFGIAQTGGFVGLQQPACDCLRFDVVRIDATTVVAYLYDHLIAMVVRIQAKSSVRRFALAGPLAGIFNTVAHGVADQVSEGFGDCIQNALVQIGIFSTDHDFNFASALLRKIAHHTRKA